MHTSHIDHVPDDAAWYGYEGDLDVMYLHERFFGKSHEQVQEYFGNGSSIERMDELLFAPRPVFQYYIQSFAMYVMSPAAAGDPDTASAFLSLLEARDERKYLELRGDHTADSVREIYPLVATCIEFIATHQDYFDAEIEIYGNFKERAESIAQSSSAQPTAKPEALSQKFGSGA